MAGDPDPEDPENPGVEDGFQDELDISCGGKLPPDRPDADLLDDLDL